MVEVSNSDNNEVRNIFEFSEDGSIPPKDALLENIRRKYSSIVSRTSSDALLISNSSSNNSISTTTKFIVETDDNDNITRVVDISTNTIIDETKAEDAAVDAATNDKAYDYDVDVDGEEVPMKSHIDTSDRTSESRANGRSVRFMIKQDQQEEEEPLRNSATFMLDQVDIKDSSGRISELSTDYHHHDPSTVNLLMDKTKDDIFVATDLDQSMTYLLQDEPGRVRSIFAKALSDEDLPGRPISQGVSRSVTVPTVSRRRHSSIVAEDIEAPTPPRRGRSIISEGSSSGKDRDGAVDSPPPPPQGRTRSLSRSNRPIRSHVNFDPVPNIQKKLSRKSRSFAAPKKSKSYIPPHADNKLPVGITASGVLTCSTTDETIVSELTITRDDFPALLTRSTSDRSGCTFQSTNAIREDLPSFMNSTLTVYEDGNDNDSVLSDPTASVRRNRQQHRHHQSAKPNMNSEPILRRENSTTTATTKQRQQQRRGSNIRRMLPSNMTRQQKPRQQGKSTSLKSSHTSEGTKTTVGSGETWSALGSDSLSLSSAKRNTTTKQSRWSRFIEIITTNE